jgi:hypothetical protein
MQFARLFVHKSGGMDETNSKSESLLLLEIRGLDGVFL